MVSGNVNRNVFVNIVNNIRGSEKIQQLTRSLQNMGARMRNVTKSMVSGSQRQQKSLRNLSAQKRLLIQTAERLNVTVKEVDSAMSKLGFTVQRNGQVIDAAGQKVENFSGQVETTVQEMRPFRFELLSVMFAGMALQRAFSSLTRTSKQWMGVMDVFSKSLGILFLPIANQMLTWALKFMDWVSGLQPEQKKAINLFVGLAGILGTIAMFIAQVGLAYAGLISLFPNLGAVINRSGGLLRGLGKLALNAGRAVFTGIKAIAAAIGAPVAAVIAVVTAVIIGAINAWKTNFMNFRGTVKQIWEGIKQIFQGVFQFLKGLVQIIVGVFTLNFEKIGEGFKNVGKGVLNFFFGIVRTIVSIVGAIATAVLGFVDKVVSLIPGMDGLGEGISNFDPAKKIKNRLPSFQSGGIVDSDGLAMVHQGERITPSGQTGGAGAGNVSINVNANVSSDMDMKRLAEKIKDEWLKENERLSGSRGRSR